MVYLTLFLFNGFYLDGIP